MRQQSEVRKNIESRTESARTSPLRLPPSVYDYDNYRLFLKDWFDWKKSVQKNYSGAVFAKRAGLHAHGLLSMIIRGKRSLSFETIRAFSRALQLKFKDSLFFERLVFFNQAKNSEDRSFYFEQLNYLGRANQGKFLTEFSQYAQYLSHWSIVAVRELLHLEDFKEDPEWISQKFKRKISKKEAAAALELLQSLQMIVRDPVTKRLVPKHRLIDIDIQRMDFAVKSFHKAFVELSKEMLEEGPREDREFFSLAFAASRSEIPRIREKLVEFRKNMNRDFSADVGQATDVVALNCQLLVLTQDENQKTPRGSFHVPS